MFNLFCLQKFKKQLKNYVFWYFCLKSRVTTLAKTCGGMRKGFAFTYLVWSWDLKRSQNAHWISSRLLNDMKIFRRLHHSPFSPAFCTWNDEGKKLVSTKTKLVQTQYTIAYFFKSLVKCSTHNFLIILKTKLLILLSQNPNIIQFTIKCSIQKIQFSVVRVGLYDHCQTKHLQKSDQTKPTAYYAN